jgi:hypothetical protein
MKPLGVDVFTAAKERLRHVFAKYDRVVVSYSGGKDSTAVLKMALQAARELGRLPVDVLHFDEEVLLPETVDILLRTRERPEVRLTWVIGQVHYWDASSNEQPHWTTWDPAKKDVWVREPPPFAIDMGEMRYPAPGEAVDGRRARAFQFLEQRPLPDDFGVPCHAAESLPYRARARTLLACVPMTMQHARAAVLAAALLAAGCLQVPAGSTATPTAAAGEIPFTLAGAGEAAIVVPVRLNGKGPYGFVLDTGATLTCLDTALADELSLPQAAGVAGRGATLGGSGRVELRRLESIAIGEAGATGVTVCALVSSTSAGRDSRCTACSASTC